MSHFLVVVLADPDQHKSLPLEGAVETLIERYSEDRHVEEHEKECHCVGWTAKIEAREGARVELSDWLERLEAGRAEAAAIRDVAVGASHGEVRDMDLPILCDSIEVVRTAPIRDEQVKKDLEQRALGLDAKWKTLQDEREEVEKRLTREHPLYGKPDPECEDCEGSGRMSSTANPEGFWDWWGIGGRWTGFFEPEYDPAADSANIETCPVCGGVGKRWWVEHEESADNALGIPTSRSPATSETPGALEEDCNGCDGTGKAVKWPTEWVQRGNTIVTAELLKTDSPVGYAVVTPDGEWHQKGRIGWFGTSSDDMSEETWVAYVRSLYEAHPATVAVAVDCHI